MDSVALWNTVLGEVELSISTGNFRTWFKQTKPLRHSDEEFVVGVPNLFCMQQIELRYGTLIKDLLNKNGAQIDQLSFKTYTPKKKTKRTEDEAQISLVDDTTQAMGVDQDSTTDTKDTVYLNSQSSKTNQNSYTQGLNPKYTFDGFVPGSGNELAYAACEAITANPGTKYNPLFVYGGVGIGKTHLIQAVGNEILKNNPESKVVYITSEQFVKEFTDSVRFKKMSDFSKRYRTTDVLIVDDIQFFANKEKTQEEFFHTFNVLHQANKQVIISSDTPPHLIPTLEERLKSRFQMGMSIDMQTPDLETRMAILMAKADTHSFFATRDCYEFLADSFPTNIRELEGALNQLMAVCEMRKINEATLEVAKMVFANKTTARPKRITSRNIVDKVAKYYRLDIEILSSPKRDKDIVVPRQVAMYLLRSELKMSYPRIANELGRKDHTTALHSVGKIEKELAFDLVLKQQIKDILEQING